MREPAAIGAAVAAVVSLIVLLVFGHELSKQEEAAIVTVVIAVAGLWTRSKVQPVG